MRGISSMNIEGWTVIARERRLDTETKNGK